MNRSCLIILKLLKLSYYNRACKSSMKNTLEQILNHYRKKKKRKTQRFNKNWFDKIPFDWILSYSGNGHKKKILPLILGEMIFFRISGNVRIWNYFFAFSRERENRWKDGIEQTLNQIAIVIVDLIKFLVDRILSYGNDIATESLFLKFLWNDFHFECPIHPIIPSFHRRGNHR